MKPENNQTTHINVHGILYDIDAETDAALQSGTIPNDLQRRILQKQGPEFLSDFRRQCRLIRKAAGQIESGELPAALMPLIQSREVPSEILYKLTQHDLIKKAKKLYQHELISQEVLDTVRKEYLTPKILPALKRAFLIDAAVYLYNHGEISEAALNGFRDRSIDQKYFLVILKRYQHFENLYVHERDYCVHEQEDESCTLSHYENIPDPKQQPERIMSVSYEYSCLYEALAWLSPEDHRLIHYIFFEKISQRQLAKDFGVSEGTIRYRKNCALRRLRVLLEGVFQITHDDIFEPDRM